MDTPKKSHRTTPIVALGKLGNFLGCYIFVDFEGISEGVHKERLPGRSDLRGPVCRCLTARRTLSGTLCLIAVKELLH